MAETCEVTNGKVHCTLPKDHEGLHQWHEAPPWSWPPRAGECPYKNAKGEQCALPTDHWEAHRNAEGVQFIHAEASLPDAAA